MLTTWQLSQALTRILAGLDTVRLSRGKKSVKLADKPDFVRCTFLRRRSVTAINLGRGSPTRLGATYPPTQRTASLLAYLVLLRVEIARFTRRSSCPEHRLVSVALILTSRWRGVTSYAVLCSPDVPPVPGFPYGTSGGLACFTA